MLQIDAYVANWKCECSILKLIVQNEYTSDWTGSAKRDCIYAQYQQFPSYNPSLSKYTSKSSCHIHSVFSDDANSTFLGRPNHHNGHIFVTDIGIMDQHNTSVLLNIIY